jgi:ABC-type microcin C transport system permease subunit YejB
MLRYLVHRVLSVVPTLFVVSVVVFALQHILPGDAATALAGGVLDPKIIAQIRSEYHLDQPMVVQYGLWLDGVLHGDLGESLRNYIGVAQLIAEKLPATALLSTMAMTCALFIGVPDAGSRPSFAEMNRISIRPSPPFIQRRPGLVFFPPHGSPWPAGLRAISRHSKAQHQTKTF